jgi:hypothetical protein
MAMGSTSKACRQLPRLMSKSIPIRFGKLSSFTRRRSFGVWPLVERKLHALHAGTQLIRNSLIMEGYDVTVLGSFYGHRMFHVYLVHTASLICQLLSFDDLVYPPKVTPLVMPFPHLGNRVSVMVLPLVVSSVSL